MDLDENSRVKGRLALVTGASGGIVSAKQPSLMPRERLPLTLTTGQRLRPTTRR